MPLGSTQTLPENSMRNVLGGKVRLDCTADNVTAICESTLYKTCQPRRLTKLWASTTCNSDYTFMQSNNVAVLIITFLEKVADFLG
jgi:hypothetical protein